MRIHSLEIVGFKSFGSRSTLAFGPGISAIVGPNGCGKSNVVDAIRWVMGEQNPRKLRGRQMEDIIFAGTETQPAVGLAEVCMTLDNSSGTAPAPYTGFSEIQVTRRLYRSGESEYLINKVAVRLRDVLDFFLDTGIGARGYTIVEQGAIAGIVSSKPEERRQIFEEAAGIGKYRARRKETESKLKSTEQNLLRVNDVLGELKRQAASLERQAKKATRYKELSSKLRDLELGVTAENFKSGQERMAQLEREVADVRAASLGLDARVSRAESLLEAGRRSHLDRDRELQAQSEQLYAVRGEIQTLESQIQWETRERESLSTQADERDAEAARLETQVREGELAHAQCATELVELDARLEALRAELAERERAHQAGSERLSGLHRQREASQAQQLRLASESAKLESRASSLEERARELESRLVASEQRLAASAEQAEGLSAQASELEGRLAGGRAEQDDLGRHLTELLRSQEQTHAALEERRRDLAHTREELQQIGARLETLREAERDATRRMGELLAGLPEEEQSGIRGLLSQVIRVDDGYERAFEAAMSHRSDLVLVDDSKAALALLGSFRRLSAVRASALPLASGGRTGPPRGFVPLGRSLLGFVQTEQALQLLLERLLRDVYVVDSLAEAVERYGVAELPGVFVTRDGDILERNGVLTSGGGASGVLSRAGEIRRLEARADPLDTRAGVLAREVAELEHQVEVLAQQTDTTRSRRHSAELAVVNLERDLQRTRERGEEVRSSQEATRSGQESVRAERQRVAEEREQIGVRLVQIAEERQAAEQSHRTLAGDTAALAREIEQSERQVSESRVEIAGRSARRSQVRETDQRLGTQLVEQRALIARRREEVRSARERIAVLEQSSGEAQRTLTGLIEQEEEVRSAQEEMRQRFEEAVRDLEGLEAEVKAATRERGEVRERVAERELAVQEVRIRQEQLRERILERYGVELATYQPPAQAGTPAERQAELSRLRQSLESLGDVHLGSIEEHEEVSERHRYLAEQKADLEVSLERLRSAIARINRTSRTRFKEAFDAINAEFQSTFPRMFRGGRAHLTLTETEDVLDAGIEITAQPPGKRLQSVSLLSGGEKSLTALALLMAVFTVRPSPFFLLDEVDAALDDANTGRYDAMLRAMADRSQFLVITHNKSSIESADRLFGVTMQEPGLSKLVTVELVA